MTACPAVSIMDKAPLAHLATANDRQGITLPGYVSVPLAVIVIEHSSQLGRSRWTRHAATKQRHGAHFIASRCRIDLLLLIGR